LNSYACCRDESTDREGGVIEVSMGTRQRQEIAAPCPRRRPRRVVRGGPSQVVMGEFAIAHATWYTMTFSPSDKLGKMYSR